MSVSLNPSSNLGFKRPLTQLVKRSLTITNNNAQPIAFKVKTTAPKLYCVRPNSGRVEPGQSQEVSVMLQAMKEEPPLNAKCKDKFLIQSTIITADKEAMSLSEIWAATDGNEEGKVYQQKLRVSYLPAEGQTLEEEDETAAAVGMTSILSDANAYETVSQHPINGAAPMPSAFTVPIAQKISQDEPPQRSPSPPVAILQESRAPQQPPAPAQAPAQQQQQPEIPTIREPSLRAPTPPPSIPVPAPAPVVVEQPVQHVPAPAPQFEEPKPRAPPAPVRAPEPVPAPAPAPIVITKENPVNQQLLAENKVLKAEIERLKNELAVKFTQPPPVAELRRRRHSEASEEEEDARTVVEEPVVHHQQDGVPLNVVVAISFAVFFTTYLFF